MRDKNKELMLRRGSKTGAYDADAPDQWKFNLRHGVGEVKAMAWIQSKTIAYGHESPYCVDEHGNSLYIDNMALECGWAEQTARNHCSKFEREGRIRLEKKHIWYAADVPLAYTDLPPDEPVENDDVPGEDDQTEGRNKSEKSNCVQSYVAKFINKLPNEKRREALKKIEAFSSWKDEFLNDGMAELRAIADRVEDSTLREIGIPKKRLPKRRASQCKWVQLKLIMEPNFVQSYAAEAEANSVQGADANLYKPKTDPVQTKNGGASFSVSTTTTTKLASGSAPGEREVAELQEFLHDVAAKRFPRLKPPTPNNQTCVNIWRVARARKPDAVSIEIAEAVASFAAKNAGFETWGGVVDLLRKSWSNGGVEPVSPGVGVATCWNCGKPISGGSINGACFDCVEANQKKDHAEGAGGD